MPLLSTLTELSRALFGGESAVEMSAVCEAWRHEGLEPVLDRRGTTACFIVKQRIPFDLTERLTRFLEETYRIVQASHTPYTSLMVFDANDATITIREV